VRFFRDTGRRRVALLVVAIGAAGLNLRSPISSLPPVFPELQMRLHLSSAVLSLLAATPVVCFGLGAMFAASLSRRFGEERVLGAALVALTAGLLLRGLAPGVLLFPGTILATSAIALLNVLTAAMIKRRWPERSGLGIGIFLTGLSLGAVLASLLSVPVYNASGGSLRLTLGLWAGPAALAALLWIPQLRYGRGEHGGATEGPQGGPGGPPVSRGGLGGIVPPRAKPIVPPRAKPYKYSLAWQVTAFMGLQSLLYYAALSWLPTMFQDRGDSAVTAGNLLALMGLGNLATSMVVPLVAQRLHLGQRRLVIPSAIGTAAGLAGSLWGPLGSAPAWVLVLGVCQGATLGLAVFFTMARAPDPGTAASLSGLAQSVGYLVASTGPLALGLLHSATGGWGIPFGLLLVLTACELGVGLLAARPLVLPGPANTTRVSVSGQSSQASPGLQS
jgi:MFS transporter, CP family, cyanate transporter